MQAFACLEGPVLECYENEIITIGNPAYPTRETTQHLVDDYLFALIFVAEKNGRRMCSCSIFMPIPTPAQLTSREFEVTYLPLSWNEGVVQFDDVAVDADKNGPEEDGAEDCRHGLPPEIVIPLDQNKIGVRFVHKKDDASVMVGYQVMSEEVVVATHRLYHSFKIGDFRPSEINVSCKQLSGHLSNDNKQINILTGQCSCSVGYPMPCYMVSKNNPGVAPKYIHLR